MKRSVSQNEMRPVSPEELKRLQIELLESLDRYCQAHDLKYFMSGGTLLGAVRHHGFIPWDDDIDVVMPRRDYEKLIRQFNSGSAPGCRVVSIFSHPDFYLPYAKLINTNTVFREHADSSMEIGVNIDIFPIDAMSSSYGKASRHFDSVAWSRKKLELKTVPLRAGRAWYKNEVLRLGKLALSRTTPAEISKEIDKKAKTFQAEEDSAYVCVVVNAVYGKNEIIPRDFYSERVELDFEGRKFWAPKAYDKILSRLYGDYMTPPPVEKRITHHAFEAFWKE